MKLKFLDKLFKGLDLVTQKRILKFLKIRRSKYALLIICCIFSVSLFSELIANSNPLMVSYKGNIFFPIKPDISKKFFIN